MIPTIRSHCYSLYKEATLSNITNALDIFYRVNIIGNSALELIANGFFIYVYTLLGMKEIQVLDKGYWLRRIVGNDFFRPLIIAYVLAITILHNIRILIFFSKLVTTLASIGTVIKLANWLIHPDDFKRNKQLFHMRREEFENKRQESSLLKKYKLQKFQNKENCHLLLLPSDMLKEIAEFLDKEGLKKFSLASRQCYVIARSQQSLLMRLIDANRLPTDVLSVLGGTKELVKNSQIKLFAHTFELNSKSAFQRYDRKDLQIYISRYEMGKHRVVWGVDPVPFIAFQNEGYPLRRSIFNQLAVYLGFSEPDKAKTFYFNQNEKKWVAYLPEKNKTIELDFNDLLPSPSRAGTIEIVNSIKSFKRKG